MLTGVADESAWGGLRALIQQQPADDLGSADRVALGQRRAGAAITLLRRGEREGIFDALRVQDDPEALTQFIHITAGLILGVRMTAGLNPAVRRSVLAEVAGAGSHR